MKNKFFKLSFLSLFATFLCISGVTAQVYDAIDYTAQFYDNIDGNLISANTELSTSVSGGNTFYIGGPIGLTAKTSGGAWGISSPIPLLANHSYTLSLPIDFDSSLCGHTILSSINRIGVGNSFAEAVLSYENNTSVDEIYSTAINDSNILQYVFKPLVSANYIVFPFATSGNCNSEVYIDSITIEDMGSDGVTQEQINESLNNQTTEINNSIDGAKDEINSNIDDMEENISGAIKDNFNNCRPSSNLFDSEDWYDTLKNINSNNMTKEIVDGVEYYKYRAATIWNYEYMKGAFKENTQYTLSFIGRQYNQTSYNSTGFSFFYTDGTSEHFYVKSTLSELPHTITSKINKTIDHIKLSYAYDYFVLVRNIMLVESSLSKPYEPYGQEVCSNKIDETNEQLGNLNDNITSEQGPDTSGLANVAGWLPPGPVDSILTLPLTMLNSLNNALSGTCNPLPLTLPFVNYSFNLPCISTLLEEMNATSFWNWTGSIVSILMLYSYLLKLYKWVDDTLSFRENNHIDNWGGI